ncbi:MAG TPA: sigma-54 dependent transcriptional regulator [Candidatus Acidoferrales bacterium]|nr:sigma-54 dependent transcriptional regulator [Candidatus Acidoferrales bacterium]
MGQTILIIDDEVNLRRTLAEILLERGYDVLEAGDGSEAIDLLGKTTPDLVFSDWRMPKMGGEEVLRYMRTEQRLAAIPIIVITAFGSSHNAIEAVRLGAYDFVIKPFDLEEISLTVERALAHSSLNREVTDLRARIERQNTLGSGRLVGSSGPMLDAFKMIGKVAETDTTVLICGESGTGKELVAEAIHKYSRRKDKAFVVVNCAALPENLLESELFGHEKGSFTGAAARKIGRFEMAEGGTIFLDEIGELSQNLQAKLLRVLQDHTFERVGGTDTISGDFRVLAATNRDLDATVREKLFREDLFYRLNVVRITVPPLRERRADIIPLAEHFLRLYSEKNEFPPVGFSEEAALMLQTYSYPGNVRELENMVERAVLMARGRVILPTHFPQRNGAAILLTSKPVEVELLSLPFHKAVGELEKKLIENAIELSSGNKTDAANRLQINRRLLYQKMTEHQIKE